MAKLWLGKQDGNNSLIAFSILTPLLAAGIIFFYIFIMVKEEKRINIGFSEKVFTMWVSRRFTYTFAIIICMANIAGIIGGGVLATRNLADFAIYAPIVAVMICFLTFLSVALIRFGLIVDGEKLTYSRIIRTRTINFADIGYVVSINDNRDWSQRCVVFSIENKRLFAVNLLLRNYETFLKVLKKRGIKIEYRRRTK